MSGEISPTDDFIYPSRPFRLDAVAPTTCRIQSPSKRGIFLKIIFFCFIPFFITTPGLSSSPKNAWPKTVLITNDNGIEDVKIRALAKAFSNIAETYVVAPKQDRSGTSNYLICIQQGSLVVERRTWGAGIHAFAVEGYPADCVVLALTGIMKDKLPDLIISGVNGGPNLGADWIFSGTIGAARVASLSGIPTLALSGLDDDLPGAVDAVNQWILALAQSETVREMPSGCYLTVSFPRIPPSDIKGVRLTRRQDPRQAPVFKKTKDLEGAKALWSLAGIDQIHKTLIPDRDEALYQDGYIVAVPSRMDEYDPHWRSLLERRPNPLPVWQPRAP